MELSYSDLGDDVRKIDLKGRMDVEGTNAVGLRFTALTATQKLYVIVDLTEVDFIASIGLAALVRSAKAARQRDGNLVLLNPSPNVTRVLASSGLDHLLPICRNVEEARLLLRKGPSTTP